MQYGQVDIPREVSSRRADRKTAPAANFPSIPILSAM